MQVATEKLMHDLRAVVGDTEDLLKATAGQTGERIEKIRTHAEESLRNARTRIQATGGDAREAVQAAARELNGEVHERPWTAVGVAAGIGVLVGILLARR
jgi:ElaB/YqjD/DUF883 family membrane-anchored ribosome-binding protein